MSRSKSGVGSLIIPTQCTLTISNVPSSFSAGVLYTDIAGANGQHIAYYDAYESQNSGDQIYSALFTVTATRHYLGSYPITENCYARIRLYQSDDKGWWQVAMGGSPSGLLSGAFNANGGVTDFTILPSGTASVLSAWDFSVIANVSPSAWS